MLRCLGVDLHSDSLLFREMAMDEQGKFKTTLHHYKLHGESFKEFLDYLKPDDYILLEASSNAFWFHDQVIPRVKECYVYDTNKARREGNKTDKIDTGKLAKKLAFHLLMKGTEDDMPTVYVPELKARELRSLFTTYKLYKKTKIQIKNRIHSLFKENGICFDKKELDNKNALNFIKEKALPDIYKSQVINLYGSLIETDKFQETITNEIVLLGSELFQEEVERLISITGFSYFTAMAFMSDVVDINRFKNVKKICSYLRTAPKIKESNKKKQMGNVNRASRTTTVTLLTQSLNHFIKSSDHMNEFYKRVKKGKSAGKARLAVVRKTIVAAYNMLKRKKQYYHVNDILYQKKLKEYHKILNKLKLQKEEQYKIA